MGKSLENRNASIDYLKALCAIFVIFQHSISHVNMDYGCAIPRWMEVVTAPIYVHVPLFFVIGGYLSHHQPLKEYFPKKIRRVIVPFYFFCVLKLLYTNVISDKFSHAPNLPGQLYESFILGGLYWFPYAIFLFYCIAPLMWWKLKDKPIGCWIVFVFSLTINIKNPILGLHVNFPHVFQISTAMQFLPFFSIGMLIQNYKELFARLNRNKIVISTLGIALYVALYLLEETDFFSNYFFWFLKNLSVMVVLYNIVEGEVFGGIPILRRISDYTYQLMLIDSFFRVVILAVINKVFTVSLYWIIPQTILTILCGVLVCEFVSSKTKVLKFLFGL